jgi:hypothetical protein
VLPEAGLAVTLLTNGGHTRDLYEDLYREIPGNRQGRDARAARSACDPTRHGNHPTSAHTSGPASGWRYSPVTHHAFGRQLHARGDRRAAVDEFRAAHGLLAGVGAAPYLARVEADVVPWWPRG